MVEQEEAEEAFVEASGVAAEEDREAADEADPEEVVEEDAVEAGIVVVAEMPGVESGHAEDNTASSTVNA